MPLPFKGLRDVRISPAKPQVYPNAIDPRTGRARTGRPFLSQVIGRPILAETDETQGKARRPRLRYAARNGIPGKESRPGLSLKRKEN